MNLMDFFIIDEWLTAPAPDNTEDMKMSFSGKIKKEDLDKRICDVEEGATNTETYREFIMSASKQLFGQPYDFLDFNKISEEELNYIIDGLDWLLEK